MLRDENRQSQGTGSKPVKEPFVPEPVLLTRNLTRRYGSLTAVDDLCLEVFEGEILGFLGPNGAGKTTSIRMMTGLLKPDSGMVYIHGKPLQGGDPALRTRVGICPQEIVLWERLTCLEQLLFIGEMYGLPASACRKRGLELLSALDLDSRKNTQSRFLSGGMKRRLNLLMALVHDPDIIVLDEPEAGLDPQSRVLVREYIRSLARRKTVIFTTHNMDEAERISERVAIIDRGRLLVSGSIGEVKKHYGSGELLEIQIRAGSVEVQELLTDLRALFPTFEFRTSTSEHDTRFEICGSGLLEKLAGIASYFSQRSIPVGEIRLRENSLEDIFIRLTGRSLRE
jgi:ABC-2 type transport system ATP-binding protein